LMTIKQGPQESLRSYLLRFNQERLAAESQNEQYIYSLYMNPVKSELNLETVDFIIQN